MLKNVRAEAFVVFGSLAFAFNGIIAKLVLTSGLSAWRLTQLRCTGAFIFLLLFVLARKGSSLRTTKKELPWLVAYGIIGFALVQFGYFVAISRLHVSVALIIEFTAPIWILFYIRFVKKKHVPKLMWISVAMGFSGLLLVAQAWQGMTLDGLGVVAALADAFALAAYFLLGEKLVANRSTDTLTVYGFAFSSLGWAIVCPLWSFPFSIFTQKINLLGTFKAYDLPGWVLITWIIFAGTIIPYMAVLHGLRSLSASTSSVIGMLEPILAGVFAWFWLGETFRIIQLIGGVVVIAGIITADRARLKVY